MLPLEFTGDGAGDTLPLEWSGAPEETESFVVIMHHVAPDMTKWYWILYDIPAATTALPTNVRNVGKLGNNSVNGRCEYAPPHSKGPGEKTYIYTVYALSSPAKVNVQPADVTRDVLLEMLAVLDQQKSHPTKAARDRALLLVGFAGGVSRQFINDRLAAEGIVSELVAIGEELGGLLGAKCVEALGIAPGAAQSYGKAAIVGEASVAPLSA